MAPVVVDGDTVSCSKHVGNRFRSLFVKLVEFEDPIDESRRLLGLRFPPRRLNLPDVVVCIDELLDAMPTDLIPICNIPRVELVIDK